MFSKLVIAIKKVVSKLFGKESVQKALKVDVSVSDKMAKQIDLWAKMYQDKSPWVRDDTKSLNLASGIAGELARLVTLEMKSEIADNEVINDAYQKLMKSIRIETEYACAKGGIVFKPYVNDGKLCIDCVHADRIFPVRFEDGELMSCGFMERITKEQDIYTRLEFHDFTNGKCTIINKAYVNSFANGELGVGIPLSKLPEWENISEEVNLTGLTRPLFSYLKMPLANTIDDESNLGVSVYSRAVDLIREADEQYSRILWEFKGSELAIDIDESCLMDGQELPKGKDRIFRKLDIEGKDGNFYSVFSPDIRDSSLFNGLNKILQRIEFVCGLAYGTLSDAQETEKTATEILSSKQRSYSTVSDIQKALKHSLEDLIVSMSDLCALYKLGDRNTENEASFEFDDSLIVDSGTDQAIMMQEVAAGIIKPEIYLMRRYGLTEEQCKDYMPEQGIEKDPEDIDEE